MHFAFALVASIFSAPASAFCGTYVGSPGVELTNQTSQVIIARQGTRTTLSLASDYEGDALDFAMLIPVPEVLGEEDITTVRPELFQRFNNYSSPRVVNYECEDFAYDEWDSAETDGDADADADADVDDDGVVPDVVVEAEYAVGIYNIVILSAEESGSLMSWLETNGYGVSEDAEELLGEYIAGGAYFFAAKVNLNEVADGGFLEPLQFGYDSAVFSLPIRLGTLNSPGEQDVVMYILTDDSEGKVGISNYPQIEIEDECMADVYGAGGVDEYYGGQFAEAFAAEDGAGWMVEYAWSPSWCDPCSSEPPNGAELSEAGFDGDQWEAYFTRIRMRYTEQAANQDITLYVSGLREDEQIRYIVHNEELEDRFPVCGIGMVDDPGTCDDESGSEGEEGDEPGGLDTDNGIDLPGFTYEIPENADGTPRDERGCSTSASPKGAVLAMMLSVLGLVTRRRSIG
jgi:uncharacterized protein (TIGR03382 family)